MALFNFFELCVCVYIYMPRAYIIHKLYAKIRDLVTIS